VRQTRSEGTPTHADSDRNAGPLQDDAELIAKDDQGDVERSAPEPSQQTSHVGTSAKGKRDGRHGMEAIDERAGREEVTVMLHSEKGDLCVWQQSSRFHNDGTAHDRIAKQSSNDDEYPLRFNVLEGLPWPQGTQTPSQPKPSLIL